jgi:hypothetical protein
MVRVPFTVVAHRAWDLASLLLAVSVAPSEMVTVPPVEMVVANRAQEYVEGLMPLVCEASEALCEMARVPLKIATYRA